MVTKVIRKLNFISRLKISLITSQKHRMVVSTIQWKVNIWNYVHDSLKQTGRKICGWPNSARSILNNSNHKHMINLINRASSIPMSVFFFFLGGRVVLQLILCSNTSNILWKSIAFWSKTLNLESFDTSKWSYAQVALFLLHPLHLYIISTLGRIHHRPIFQTYSPLEYQQQAIQPLVCSVVFSPWLIFSWGSGTKIQWSDCNWLVAL